MSQLMEVTIYAENVDDLREQLVKFAGTYGLQLTGKVDVTDNRQAELPFNTAAPAPGEEKNPSIGKGEKSPKGRRSKKDSEKQDAQPTAQEVQPAPAAADSAPTAPPGVSGESTAPAQSEATSAAPTASNAPADEATARAALNEMVAAYKDQGIPKAREVVGKFKRADGTPAAMFSQVQSADYEALIKVCKDETAKKTAAKAS